MSEAVALDRAVLAALAEGPIVLALSGGGDSIALLHLLMEAGLKHGLRAVIIDHALREGSAEDAQRAAGFAAALGVNADIRMLGWDLHEKRSQETARLKRYAVLCAAARAAGARCIALAHTSDDQAETVFMRAANGSGWRGLAGMAALAPAPVWPQGRGLWLARPLLGVRREALRTLLRVRGADWLEDPANANVAHERVRVRATLAEHERAGLDPMRFAALATRLRDLAYRIDAAAAALIARAARFDAGEIVLDREVWAYAQAASSEVRRRALAVLITAAAGAAREPAAAATAQLEARLTAAGFRGASLGGARLRRARGGVRLSRDPGAVAGRAGGPAQPPLRLPAGEEVAWDGRLLLRAHGDLELLPALPAPLIVRHGVAASLNFAEAAGALEAEWLLQARVRQLLPGPASVASLKFAGFKSYTTNS